MPLFEVAVLSIPTKKEAEEGTAHEKLVLGPTYVVAKDTQSAGIAAVTQDKDGFSFDPMRMQVLIRPFA